MSRIFVSFLLIHIWSLEISPFHNFELRGQKQWSPSMKVQQMENSQNKMGLKGFRWSSLNVQGTPTPLYHPFLELAKHPFVTISLLLSLLLALLGNKKWSPSMKVQQMENSKNKMGLKGCWWSNLNAQGTPIPLFHPFQDLGILPFLNISPLEQKEMVPQYGSATNGNSKNKMVECPRHSCPSV